jgi:Protein of unknown function (DUF3309)
VEPRSLWQLRRHCGSLKSGGPSAHSQRGNSSSDGTFPEALGSTGYPARFPVQFSEMESAVAGAYLASSYPTDVAKVKELGTILLIILVLLLGGALPTWPYSSGWGYYPMGGLGLLLIIVLVLVLLGRV